MEETSNNSTSKNKRYFSASGSILLPLALKWRLCLPTICGTFVALILSGFAGNSVSAAELTVSVPGTPLSVQVSPDGKGATSAAATLSVSGTAPWGYTLTVSGSDKLTNGSNSLSSISQELADVSSFGTNTWGYKFTGGTIDGTKFRAGTSTTTTLDNHTTAPSTAVNYSVTLGAKVDGTQPAGSYSGTFTFTATAKTTSYSITYDLNEGTGGPSPNPQTGNTTDATINLSSAAPTRANFTFGNWCTKDVDVNASCSGTTYAPSASVAANLNTTLYAMWSTHYYTITYNCNGGTTTTCPSNVAQTPTTANSVAISSQKPTKAGYNFKGWCSVATTSATCPSGGTTYQPSGTFATTGSSQSLTLWAMWESAQPTTMQNFGSYCSSMTEGQTIKLTDSRDNNSYTVAKLKDGKCWMIDNLKLGSGLSTGSTKVLTSADSDVPTSGFTLKMTAENFNKSGNGDYDADAAYIDATYGGYYSWHTATAGTGTASMSSGNATNSICPKGWRLPTGGSSGEFQALATAYGGTGSAGAQALQAKPVPGFTLGGFIWNDGDGFGNKGSSGRYWSSTASNANYAYSLSFNSSGVYPANNYSKYSGYSVRCVSRQ